MSRMTLALALAASLTILALPAVAQGLPEPPAGLTLDQAIEKALANNPALQAARAEVSRAEGEAASTKLYPLRSLAANVGINSTVPPQNGLPAPAAGAWITLNLGDLLSTPAMMQTADARLEAARQNYRAAQLAVVSAVTEAYAAWITQQKLLALRQDAIKSSQSDVLVVQRLFGRGTATISDVLKARLAVSQSQADLVQAEGLYNKTWATLVQQMGDTTWLSAKSNKR
ncbi:MAG TPA: TolC family protein [Stenomitos sp.]